MLLKLSFTYPCAFLFFQTVFLAVLLSLVRSSPPSGTFRVECTLEWSSVRFYRTTIPPFQYPFCVRFLQSTQIISGHTISCYISLHCRRNGLGLQGADVFIRDKRQIYVKKRVARSKKHQSITANLHYIS